MADNFSFRIVSLWGVELFHDCVSSIDVVNCIVGMLLMCNEGGSKKRLGMLRLNTDELSYDLVASCDLISFLSEASSEYEIVDFELFRSFGSKYEGGDLAKILRDGISRSDSIRVA